MLRTLTRVAILIGFAISLSACMPTCQGIPPTETPTPTPTQSSAPTLTTCPEKRPEVCTFDYRPVCATRDTGVRCVTTPCPSTEQKTYGNACSACADGKVIGHIPNECATPDTTKK